MRGTPVWIYKLTRLLLFVFALLPAFLSLARSYLFDPDRVSVRYVSEGGEGGCGGTRRHFADVYGGGGGGSYDDEYDENKRRKEKEDKKPIVIFLTGGAWIIGYKMWGYLLAHYLSSRGILVIVPDYRNFPGTDAGGMTSDVDAAVGWALTDAARRFGGDPDRAVLVGQSAGAHLGACVLLGKAFVELKGGRGRGRGRYVGRRFRRGEGS